jgi:hypothetical protein
MNDSLIDCAASRCKIEESEVENNVRDEKIIYKIKRLAKS